MSSPTLHIRVTFPPTGAERHLAILRVVVEDVTRADAGAVVVGSTERADVAVPAGGEVLEVEVVPTTDADPARRFVVRVHGSVSGAVTFASGDFLSTSAVPVDLAAAQVVEVTVQHLA